MPTSMPPTMTCFPASQTTASVVMLMASADTGIINCIIFNAEMLFSISSLLTAPNFWISWSSRTKDLMTRSFVMVSRTSMFSRSSCFCILVYRGEATRMMAAMAAASTGITMTNTFARSRFRAKDMASAPMSITGLRNIPRSSV